ncbi:MAG: DUF4837 family protein [Crocinitomicaceae bacterium]
MKYLLIAIAALSLVSCGEELSREDLLPDASGEHGNILLLLEDHVWEGPIGDALVAQLDQNCEGPFLRPEPLFSYFRKPTGKMNHVNKMTRLILKIIVDTDSTYEETAIVEKYDYYARNQIFVVIKDSNPDRLLSYINNDFDYVLDLFNDFELNQLIANYKARPNHAINEQTQKSFGISISLPRTAMLKVTEDDFMLVKYEQSRNVMGDESRGTESETYWIEEGILFWTEPLDSAEYFEPYHIMATRDSVLKHNVAGNSEGSYMATEYDEYYRPEADKITFNGNETIVVRGLWKFAGHPGAFGGGPFIQYTMINKSTNELLTVCGYIYAPKFDKREYIRQVEAMLRTIEFTK